MSLTSSKIQSLSRSPEDSGAAAQGAWKVFNRVLDWITSDRMELLNITDRINDLIRKSGVKDGFIHLQSLHTTTGVFLSEWQDALVDDVRSFLEKVVEQQSYYKHNDPQFSDCERMNADSHLRGMMMGQTLMLQVRNAAVLLGTWQSIVLAEFDGPRSRSVSVQICGV
jgi:secondary thiamine-phosphate synthase enzyme